MTFVGCMDVWDALLLGVAQGFTEFFPVSSSGHLLLIQGLGGGEDLERYLLFDLVCHLGTLFALFLMLYRPLLDLIRGRDLPLLLQVVLGTLPLGLVPFFLGPIKRGYSTPALLSVTFFITAFLLFLASGVSRRTSRRTSSEEIEGGKIPEENLWRDPLYIGLMQTVAILPGISRSGATITAALSLGWSRERAFVFSFLLAVPAILAGTTFEFLEGWWCGDGGCVALGWDLYCVGFLASLFCGYLALKLLMRLMVRNSLSYFGWYCVLLGAVALYLYGLPLSV